jgi:hypothetical protein
MIRAIYVPAFDKTYTTAGDHKGPPRCEKCGGSGVVPSGDPEFPLARCDCLPVGECK